MECPSTPRPSTLSSPAWPWPSHIKFKGFKCKYFSFIDASCLQRERFLLAQLHGPISLSYLSPREPGCGVGVGGSWALSRWLSKLLSGVARSSPAVWGVGVGKLGAGSQGLVQISRLRVEIDAGAVGSQDILLFRNRKAGSLRTLAHFFSPQVPSSRPPSSRAPRRPHSPGLRGAHKARQLELKIYAKQLLTGCKGVQLCAGRGWEPALKAQEVAPRPGVKRKTPPMGRGGSARS